MSSDSSLQRQLRNMPGLAAAASGTRETPAQAPDRYQRLAAAVRGELIAHPAGQVVKIRTVHPLDERYGDAVLPAEAAGAVFDLFGLVRPGQDQTPSHRIRAFRFFDTETTGLGGAGTVAFLVGRAEVTPDGIVTEQFLLPDYDDESALLELVAEPFDDTTVLVSYNGASFDLPLINDRLILHRVARELPLAEHIDLLAAVRRLYRRRIGDCTLGNVEAQILGYHRQDDLPGYLAPLAYFDWLQTEATDGLVGVIEHNRQDIVALVFLLFRIAQEIAAEGIASRDDADLHSLSRLFERGKRIETATKIASRLSTTAEPEMRWHQSLLLKRRGEFDRAIAIWQELAQDQAPLWALRSSLELAKDSEHRRRDLAEALSWTEHCAQLAELTPTDRTALEHRRSRIMRKLRASG